MHTGYHMRESDLLIEVIDPVSGKPVADEESGEVVFTTLTRRGMPLIRYRTGDLSRIQPGTCACGSPLLRLERLHGRIGRAIQLNEANQLTMGMLDECLFQMDDIADFKATLRHGTPDVLELELTTISGDATNTTNRQTAVHTALSGIEQLAAAFATQRLHLSVVVLPSKNLPRRIGKRTITEEACL
jgi:phenylacetate-coenzyme A ligase PaaK-like adenylate-forming protein